VSQKAAVIGEQLRYRPIHPMIFFINLCFGVVLYTFCTICSLEEEWSIFNWEKVYFTTNIRLVSYHGMLFFLYETFNKRVRILR